MRALCPSCGQHHEVVRVLDDGFGDARKDVYQIAPLGACSRVWLSDTEVLEARARFDEDPIVGEDEDA